MPRFRIAFSKGDEARFLSHLDVVKAFERAIRRAEIPIAFSEGFNPHPKMNFASALAVGVTSETEYLDIELKPETDVPDIAGMLARSLPVGLGVNSGQEVSEQSPSLMAKVNRAVYKVIAELTGPLDTEELQQKIAGFLGETEVVITKTTKKGPRQRDIRPGILSLDGIIRGACAEFTLTTVAGSDGNVRPEEVIKAFIDRTAEVVDGDSQYIKRMSLYIENDGARMDPMDL